jgi:hypothetical protein
MRAALCTYFSIIRALPSPCPSVCKHMTSPLSIELFYWIFVFVLVKFLYDVLCSSDYIWIMSYVRFGHIIWHSAFLQMNSKSEKKSLTKIALMFITMNIFRCCRHREHAHGDEAVLVVRPRTLSILSFWPFFPYFLKYILFPVSMYLCCTECHKCLDVK